MTYPIERYENTLLPGIFDKITKLAASKGAEYAHGDDRLDNFRRNGADCGVTMETCWRIYAGKHWDSLTTYIKDIQTGQTREYSEDITGRALDLIVYLTLFIAMVEERHKASSPASGQYIGLTRTEHPMTAAIGYTEANALATRDNPVGKPVQNEK